MTTDVARASAAVKEAASRAKVSARVVPKWPVFISWPVVRTCAIAAVEGFAKRRSAAIFPTTGTPRFALRRRTARACLTFVRVQPRLPCVCSASVCVCARIDENCTHRSTSRYRRHGRNSRVVQPTSSLFTTRSVCVRTSPCWIADSRIIVVGASFVVVVIGYYVPTR